MSRNLKDGVLGKQRWSRRATEALFCMLRLSLDYCDPLQWIASDSD